MCPERVRNRVLNGRSGRLFAGFTLPGQARLSQRNVSPNVTGKSTSPSLFTAENWGSRAPPGNRAEVSMPGVVNRWA